MKKRDNEDVRKIVTDVKKEISKVVVGQEEILDGIIRAILCNGHVLVEGVPGIAKTLIIKSFAEVMGCEMKRVQFTVDLLPTDITGIMSYTPKKGFEIVKGPIFANFIIADEINRSPPKCVLGDTPIVTENGEISCIKDMLNKYSSENIKSDKNEFWIKPKQPLKLMSLDLKDYKIKPEEVNYLYKQKTREPYFHIKLKTGRNIKTSRVHPFFTLQNGFVKTRNAEGLKEGDCVLIPKKLNLVSKEELVYDKKLVGCSNEVFKEIIRRKEFYDNVQKLKQSGISKKEIANNLGVSESDGVLRTFLKSKPLYLNIKEERFFSKSKQFGQVSSVKMPKKVTKELAQFIAILISKGCVNNGYFYLTMKDKEIPEYFIKLCKELFDINTNLFYDNKREQYKVAFGSDALVSLLLALGYKPYLKAKAKEIPCFIMQANDEIIKEFLKMYYECDGCVSRDCVKVTTKSMKIANGLSYLLLRTGLVARIDYRRDKTYIGDYKYKRKFYNLRLYGTNINNFLNEIGFFSKEKNDKLKSLTRNLNGEKTDLLPQMHGMIRGIRKLSGITHKQFFEETSMHAHNIENPNNSLMHSRCRLKRMSGLLKVNNYLIEQLDKVLSSDFYCDFVKSAEKIEPKKDYWLYDFSMEKNHSFIAGFGGIISHNTQSAMIEAMEEKAVTIARKTYPLPKPFFVMATENPLEVSGVYSLPEAQIDRFLFKLIIDYPLEGEEKDILDKNVNIRNFEDYKLKKILSPQKILELQKKTKEIFSSDAIKDYIVQIVDETRKKDHEYAKYISYGASPRASIAIYIASKAEAMMKGRKYVIPQDVKTVAYPILRHRIILNYEAEAEKILTDDVIKYLLKRVHAP